MIPTAKLRFVERQTPAPEYGEDMSKTIRVLQQWWASDWPGQGEWRDVPLEEEEEDK